MPPAERAIVAVEERIQPNNSGTGEGVDFGALREPVSTASRTTGHPVRSILLLYFGQAMVSRNTLSVFASTSCGTSWSRVSSFPVFISIT